MISMTNEQGVLEALAIAIIEEMCFYQKCKITAE